MISADARETAERATMAARDAGASVLMGGARLTESPFADGYYFSPTIMTGVAADAPLAQEEIFGPVLAVLPARDLDEALRLANGAPYGLSVSLFTRDLNAVLSYLPAIDCGMVRVNGDTTGVDPHAPFGGMRGSSSHSREQGPAAMEFFTDLKTVQINPAGG